MKILSASQTHNVDQYTIEHEPISSIELMERASQAFTDIFIERVSPKKKLAVVCGRGNNGGDGLAIARMLSKRHYEVTPYVIHREKEATVDFRTNEKRLEPFVEILSIDSEEDIPDFTKFDVIIDGIFGSGLSRPLEGLYASVVTRINQADRTIWTIDIASGLRADAEPQYEIKVEADVTVTFQLPKLAFLLPQNAPYVGEWLIADIRLLPEGVEQQETIHYFIDKDMVSAVMKARKKYDHKGTHGRAILMVGSYGKIGAAVLASQGAMRSGLGLLTVYIPGCGYDILQATVPEAMVQVDEGDHFLTSAPDLTSFDAVGIGPGIGLENETMMSLIEMAREVNKPVVVDADALNIIAHHKEILEMLPTGSILTPHPGEFERLVGKWDTDKERIERQVDLAKTHQLIIVVKGAHTTIALPNGNLYFNGTGNPGMGTGGSGDVLTGILTALLAQGYEPWHAAIAGIYIHGLAGDMAAAHYGEIAMNASDIIRYLPEAFKSVKSHV